MKSKFNEKNIILAVNLWAVSVARYGAGMVNWRKSELEAMDRKTGKRMTMYGMLHQRAYTCQDIPVAGA